MSRWSLVASKRKRIRCNGRKSWIKKPFRTNFQERTKLEKSLEMLNNGFREVAELETERFINWKKCVISRRWNPLYQLKMKALDNERQRENQQRGNLSNFNATSATATAKGSQLFHRRSVWEFLPRSVWNTLCTFTRWQHYSLHRGYSTTPPLRMRVGIVANRCVGIVARGYLLTHKAHDNTET